MAGVKSRDRRSESSFAESSESAVAPILRNAGSGSYQYVCIAALCCYNKRTPLDQCMKTKCSDRMCFVFRRIARVGH